MPLRPDLPTPGPIRFQPVPPRDPALNQGDLDARAGSAAESRAAHARLRTAQEGH